MNYDKKITLDVALDNEKYVNFLMSKINFKETSRIATGGMMSTPSLLIEYQGDKENYHERGYLKIGNQYFTIKHPNGCYFATFDDFLNDQSVIDIFDYKEI
jgi:hypothetical protein